MGQAATTSSGLGLPNLPCALVPGHPATQSDAELTNNVRRVTLPKVLENLMSAPNETVELIDRRDPRDIVFSGAFEDVNAFFYDQEWSDGLPIVPPTIEKVEAFLRFTPRDRDEVLGVLLPDSRAASIWSIAVNGVMAGCRPEYMPVLVALVEAMCDPEYGVEHSGNTPGAETLIILNGPIVKDLDFNFTQGALRDGFIANTTIGRFWRLYLRNVAGFLLHKTDKATFGNTWRVALAENEDAIREIGWTPNSVDMGFEAGDNTVTVVRYTGGGVIAAVTGDTPDKIMPYLADRVAKQCSWELFLTVGLSYGMVRPTLILSPLLASIIAKAGWSKSDVKRYLFDHARISATMFETYLNWTNHSVVSLTEEANLGRIPQAFNASSDPSRMVPIVFDPGDFMVLVSGDPLRNNAYAFSQNGYLGYPTAKKIDLPAEWDALLAARPARGRP